MLSKEVSRTIFWVFDVTRPEIEPQSPGNPSPLANTLPLICRCYYYYYYFTLCTFFSETLVGGVSRKFWVTACFPKFFWILLIILADPNNIVRMTTIFLQCLTISIHWNHSKCTCYNKYHCVMVIVVWIRHGDMLSNPGRGWLHFT